MKTCIKANGCSEKATETVLEMKKDKLKVTRREYLPNAAEIESAELVPLFPRMQTRKPVFWRTRQQECRNPGNNKNDAEVVLYVIEGGGHTWPGMDNGPAFLGASTMNINANEILWEFFKKHPMK